MKTKNILILIPTMQKGGAERVVSLLLKEFVKDESINLHLIQMEDGLAYQLPSNIKYTVISKAKKSGIRKLVELPFVAWRLSKYIKENDIDIVMSFLYRANYVNILSRYFGVEHKAIINIRSTTSRYLTEGLVGKINLLLIGSLFNKADLIVSNSQGVDEDLKSLITISTNTKVIHNPLDIKYITSKKEICEDIAFDFKKDVKYIISIGRLIPLKRNKDLIDAFYELQKKDEALELIFLGNGEEKSKLLEYAQALHVEKYIHFLGNVSNPFYYLNKSHLFVLNSQTEGFPNVLVEAMAVGLPVVSSDCRSGPREILEDERYGYLYPVGDVEKLVEKMKIILYSGVDREKIKLDNLKRVEEFRIDKIMKEFREVL